MTEFKNYYAALLRGSRFAEPRADEALRDYVDMVMRIQAQGMF